MIPDLSKQLLEVLDYNPDTGVFVWLKNRGGTALCGSIAGNVQKHGYRYINFQGKLIAAHRLAWLYVNFRWPDGDIDHINRIRDDNRIANLRETSRSQNMRNSIRKRTIASPYQGTCFDKQSGRWLACITSNGRQINLGRYSTPEEAHEAYVKASVRIHGEYSAF